uniref:Uncharacterized protein n=1 Tax=Eutreptiella gymnastica TaxID=73025 RepID=A0A7S4CAK2_9EUGL
MAVSTLTLSPELAPQQAHKPPKYHPIHHTAEPGYAQGCAHFYPPCQTLRAAMDQMQVYIPYRRCPCGACMKPAIMFQRPSRQFGSTQHSEGSCAGGWQRH